MTDTTLNGYKPMPRSRSKYFNQLLLLVMAAQTCAAAAFTEANIVRAIVGEGAACDYEVKRGLASAIYNRGTLDGVYGVHASHNKSEPKWVWQDARRAAKEGRTNDFVYGASYFGDWRDVENGTFIGHTFVCALGTGKNTIYFYR